MKRAKSDPTSSRRFKLLHLFFGLGAVYLIFLSFKLPQFSEITKVLNFGGEDSFNGIVDEPKVGWSEAKDLRSSHMRYFYKDTFHRKLEDNENQNTPIMPTKEPLVKDGGLSHIQYGTITGLIMKQNNKSSEMSVLERMADEAWTLGLKAWNDLEHVSINESKLSPTLGENPETCPSGLSMTVEEFRNADNVMFLPCGLCAGSSITLVGTPHVAHKEFFGQFEKLKGDVTMIPVSQFVIELQGLKAVDGEDPPRILHLNPRLKGDWSFLPVIEHNTCYRAQWGVSQRCIGIPSNDNDDMLVDGYKRCEKWIRADSKESNTSSWFKRFIGREQKPEVSWVFPFIEGRLFILTVRAGVDGFHISVGGQHVTSFPYRTGFTLEDATGLVIKGNLDVHSVYATSLPASHPSFSPHRVLEFSPEWKAQLLSSNPRLFIGVLSSTNHFAERMAVRKTWMQSSPIKSSLVVARFFVALNPRKEVNRVLKDEAAYFGDIVILPFMDRYELVVIKTIAICEYGIKNTTATHIMKCDDDTFIRVETVLKEMDFVSPQRPLYMGNLNLFHRPLRSGKWSVSYEEWPEAVYPPYANGPAYIISQDIARFILSQHMNHSLRMFKMEDVSMGMWVEQFNASSSRRVQYSHSWNFCQYGCKEDYFTAHYQSPRQMMCLWEKLKRGRGRASCCNFR